MQMSKTGVYILLLPLIMVGLEGAWEWAAAGGVGCEAIVGQWRWFNAAIVECHRNGRCEATNGFHGPWKCLDASGRFEIRWGRGNGPAQYVDTLALSPDGTKLSGKNQLGGRVWADRTAGSTERTRVKPPRTGKDQLEPTYSSDQRRAIEEFGIPDTFSIIFFSTEENPAVVIRRELWRYYGHAKQLTFLDGHLINTASLEPLSRGARMPHYRPDMFHHDMKIDAIAERFGIDAFVKEEIPDEGGDLAEIYWAEQIAFGFSNSLLVFVESMPSVPGGGAQ
jgi:hypothetical protein